MGIDDESRAAAKDLANQGYNVLIADIYGSVDTPTDMESAKKILKNSDKRFNWRLMNL